MDWKKINGDDFYKFNPAPTAARDTGQRIETRRRILSLGRLKEQRRKSVDELNENEAAWKNASRWEKLKYTIKNPIAVMRHNTDSAQQERKVREEARALARQKIGAYGYSGPEAAQIDISAPTAKGEKPSLGTRFGNGVKSVAPPLGQISAIQGEVTYNLNTYAPKEDITTAIKAVGEYIDLASAGVGVVKAAVDIKSAVGGIIGGIIDGKPPTLNGVLALGGNAASLAMNVVKVGKFAAKHAENAAFSHIMNKIPTNLVPGLGIVANGVAMINSGAKVIKSQVRLNAAANNEKAIASITEERGDDKMTQWMAGLNSHASRKAKIDRNEAKVGTGTAAAKTAAAVLSLSGVGTAGVGAAAGAALKAGAAVVDITNAQYVKQARKTAMADRVNDVTNLDAHMQKLMEECPGLPRSDAKHMILQQWGFKSGKRSEVFLNIAKKDAALIQQMDAAPDEESRKVAGMLKGALGVDANAGQEALMEAMGVDKESAKNIDAAIAQKRAKDRTSGIFKPKADPHHAPVTMVALKDATATETATPNTAATPNMPPVSTAQDPHHISVGLPHVPMAAAPKPQVAITPNPSEKSKTAGNNL